MSHLSVAVFMRVAGEQEVELGRARSVDDVPRLLRAAAEGWQRKVYVDAAKKRYFANDPDWADEPDE